MPPLIRALRPPEWIKNLLVFAGLLFSGRVDEDAGALVALYGGITAAYTLVLKRLVIIDVMTIASLFLLRVIAGAVAVEAQASESLLVCTAMLALFLGFTQRRQEAILEQLPAASSASR